MRTMLLIITSLLMAACTQAEFQAALLGFERGATAPRIICNTNKYGQTSCYEH